MSRMSVRAAVSALVLILAGPLAAPAQEVDFNRTLEALAREGARLLEQSRDGEAGEAIRRGEEWRDEDWRGRGEGRGRGRGRGGYGDGEGFLVTRDGPNAGRIPPGHLPPPGACRRWSPDLPPGRQPPPFRC